MKEVWIHILVGKEVGGGFRRERTCVCLWPIHVDIWQKQSQYDKIIILQLGASLVAQTVKNLPAMQETPV